MAKFTSKDKGTIERNYAYKGKGRDVLYTVPLIIVFDECELYLHKSIQHGAGIDFGQIIRDCTDLKSALTAAQKIEGLEVDDGTVIMNLAEFNTRAIVRGNALSNEKKVELIQSTIWDERRKWYNRSDHNGQKQVISMIQDMEPNLSFDEIAEMLTKED